MRYEVRVDGKSHTVEITRRGGRYLLEMDGESAEVDLREINPGHYSLLFETRQYEVSILTDRYSLRVHLGPELHHAEVTDARRPKLLTGAAVTSGRQEIRAVMPGKVVRILVEPNQNVGIDDGLIVLEAMKMENEIHPELPGCVEAIHVEPGQLVESNALLLTLGPLRPPETVDAVPESQ